MKSKIKIGIIVFLIFIAVQNVAALGVSPARKTIIFEPGLTAEGTIRILNNENKDMDVALSTKGELSKYITLSSNEISFEANEGEKTFSYTLNLPQKIDKPGNHDIEIEVTELPPSETAGEKTAIKARASVISQVRIKVPYPGTYAEAELYVSSSDDRVLITVSVFNLGTEDIIAKADIKILDAENKKLADITTQEIEIKTKENKKITVQWSAPSIGAYTVLVDLSYNNKELNLQKKIYVGDMFVKVVDVEFGKFKLGEIVKLGIIAQNGWNEMIEDVYAEVFVKNKKGKTLTTLTTPSYNLEALSKRTFTAYWDTKNIGVGLYDLVIKLNYAGKKSEKIIEINVEENRITKTTIIEKAEVKLTKTTIVAISAVMIILLIVILSYLKRKKTSKK